VHQVAQRLVHATGEPELAALLRLHAQALDAGIAAIREHHPIVVDVRMVAAGVNREWLAQAGCALHCALDAPGAPAFATSPHNLLTGNVTGGGDLAPEAPLTTNRRPCTLITGQDELPMNRLPCSCQVVVNRCR
jgi:hypothetical protein